MYLSLLRFHAVAAGSLLVSSAALASPALNPYSLDSAYGASTVSLGIGLPAIAFTQSEEGTEGADDAPAADEAPAADDAPAADEAPAADDPPAAEKPAADAERRGLEADAMYQLGLGLMGKQSWGEACAVFGRIQDVYADLEMATRAGEQITMIKQIGDPACGAEGWGPTAAPAPGRASAAPAPAAKQLGENNGDIELAISQALMGTAFGVYAPFSFGTPTNGLLLSATAIAGLATGLGTSLTVANRHGVTQGQAMAVYTGEVVGITHGVFLAAELGIWNPAQPISAGFVLGGAGGIAVAVFARPTAGEMSMVRSGASWGTATGVLALTFFQIPSALVLLGGMDLGLITGAVLSQRLDVSRRRMNFINLSGYTGAAGVGILLLGAGGGSSQIVASCLFVGAGSGLVVGAHLTRNMDGDGAANGSALELRDGKWYVGMPLPEPAPVRVGEDVGMGVRLPIVKGRW